MMNVCKKKKLKILKIGQQNDGPTCKKEKLEIFSKFNFFAVFLFFFILASWPKPPK